MARKLIDLNDNQSDAVRHVWGACFVSACPGSGKTRVIVERCARLIEEDIAPRSILCLTFTNKAANEMKERLTKMVGESAKEVYISTFHALCLDVLRKYGSYLGYDKNLSVVIEEDQEALMAQCARQLEFELKVPEIRRIIWSVNAARENLEDPHGPGFRQYFKQDAHEQIAKDYIAKLKENNQVDFSGILSETINLMSCAKHVLQKLQDRFAMIQVDESQDCNLAQFKIAELLGEHTNVFMVGDTDQSIYGWRGAHPDGINNFIDKFKAKVVTLPLNYRCSKNIVDAASRLIKNNKGRIGGELETVNGEGDPIECYQFRTPDEEARWIGQEIKKLIDSGKYKSSDFAILYRANSMSRALEVAMVDAGVDYQVVGGFGFFDRKEIKDILSMLRFCANPKDGLALSRFINKPARKIGQVTIGKIEKFAKDNKLNLVQAMARAPEYLKSSDVVPHLVSMAAVLGQDFTGMPFGDIMEDLVKNLNYLEYLKNEDDESYFNRVQNMQELYTSASIYSQKKPNDIIGYLNKIALQSSADKELPDGAVTMMTIHASKGLEFPVVFLPCLDDGSLPSSMALKDRADSVEEERRLCYVAMTRAKNKLYMTHPSSRPQRDRYGGIKDMPATPSRFFNDANLKPEKKSVWM